MTACGVLSGCWLFLNADLAQYKFCPRILLEECTFKTNTFWGGFVLQLLSLGRCR